MKRLHPLLLVLSIISVSLGQLPKAGSLILSLGGTIGIPMGGIVSEENDYGSQIQLTVTDSSGQVKEQSAVDYKHFNWSGEMNIDVYFGNIFGMGLNGGYYGIQQKMVAQENSVEKTVENLEGLTEGRLALLWAVPVQDNSFINIKLMGGYSFGTLTRTPTLAMTKLSPTSFEDYIKTLSQPVDVKGPSGAFEISYNILQSYGLLGSIGIRYGVRMLKGESPATAPNGIVSYIGEDSWVDHSISATITVGFGFKMSSKLNLY